MKYFLGSYIFTALGILCAALWSFHSHLNIYGALFAVIILSILEVSLSFDNAVVNATKLEKMPPVWQQRFLTWGILIAVFGMRFLFPLLIVAIFSSHNILNVLDMALNNPDEYSKYLHLSHPFVITFGASFLMMLFLNYFLNPKKEIHWIKFIEEKLIKIKDYQLVSILFVCIAITLTKNFSLMKNSIGILLSGISGVILYLSIDKISNILEKKAENLSNSKFNIINPCIMNFLYLELIDASFSLDGVLGAFAISKDIVIITIGLSIGAMFVRSLTILLVEKKTLKEYIYLEHGAHYAIGALSIIMFISAIHEVSEVITGLIGLIFIVLAFISSVKENNKQKGE